ncbi:hypothetical protein RvY_18059 [Ramazzottius varieornatus]|uniref:Phosphoinositide phospholipase C n=1 Tax=Ramazzottius varieornatus TaxID=947166 RepID=A0A1D1WAK0_RAMVA|nr:hypothetical protein RvY_18059 [Ramazzottius varieornatus]
MAHMALTAVRVLGFSKKARFLAKQRKEKEGRAPAVADVHFEQIEFDKSVQVLLKGTVLLKVTAAKNLYSRLYVLDPDYQTIYCHDASPRFYPTCQAKTRAIDLSALREVRTGYKTDVFHICSKSRSFTGRIPEERCFSLIMSNGSTVNLVAPSVDLCKCWVNVIQYVIGKSQHEDREDRLERCDSAYRCVTDAGAITRDDDPTAPVLDANGFYRFYASLAERSEIRELFEKYAGLGITYSTAPSKKYWTTSDLQMFLLTSQREDKETIEACEFVIETFEPVDENREQKHFSMQVSTYISDDKDVFNIGFQSYLLNQRQFLFNPKKDQVYQDMSQPLSHYFIASSPVYPLDHEVVNPIPLVDCWDGPSGEPVVTHGHTFTSRILFKDVVAVIRDYGFRASPTDSALPSPEKLRGKVILKGKKFIGISRGDSESSKDDDDLIVEPARTVPVEDVTDTTIHEKVNVRRVLSKISENFSSGVYLHAVKFRSLSHAKENERFYEMSSLSETKFREGFSEDVHMQGLIGHCRRQLVRIYPDGLRTDSSNYNPIPMLRAGCQIVALNYQDKQPETRAYKALFMDNGGCGYLLKPEYMRKEEVDFEKFVAGRKAMVLSVTVISAQQLPKPGAIDGEDIADPYVTVQVFGCQRDCKKEKTTFLKNNGYRHVELYDKADNALEPATLFLYVEYYEQDSDLH